MQTRKYPRTLEEAFGPHTSKVIYSQEKMEKRDLFVIAACCLIAFLAFGLAFIGWI